jgi:hypothetical protein
LLLVLLVAGTGGADEAEAFRNRPLAQKLATPRRTVETLCFAADAYDRIPALIADAVACLDLGPKDALEPGTAELLAL